MIAYLPIYSFNKYFELFWTPKYLESEINNILNAIVKECNLQEIEKESLIRWLSYESPSIISKKICVNKKDIYSLSQNLCIIKNLVYSRETSMEKFYHFLVCKSANEKNIDNKVVSAYKNTQEGHFFINEIYDEHEIGYVIRMRRIYSIEMKACFRSKPPEYNDTNKILAYRICKMSPVIQYRTAQLFGYQFSRIGLPEEFLELSEISIRNLTNSILERIR